jgi:hypothetical protein
MALIAGISEQVRSAFKSWRGLAFQTTEGVGVALITTHAAVHKQASLGYFTNRQRTHFLTSVPKHRSVPIALIAVVVQRYPNIPGLFRNLPNLAEQVSWQHAPSPLPDR